MSQNMTMARGRLKVASSWSDHHPNPSLIQRQRLTSPSRYIIVVLAAFMISFMTGGLQFGFGIYQAHYETMALEDDTPFTGATAARLDLIGTLAISMLTICAPVVVAWSKTIGPQKVMCAGGLLVGGFLMGVGSCLSFVPSMVVVPAWFDKHRALAMGIVSAGSGVGGLVWAPVLVACIEKLGYRDTLRMTGTLGAVVVCVCGAVLTWEPAMAARIRSENTTTSRLKMFKVPLPPWKTVKQRKFIAQSFSMFCQSAAYYTPAFFFASDGANLTAVNNACNAVGKIAIGLVADRIGRLNALFLTTVICAAVTLGLWVPSIAIGMSHESVARSLPVSFTVLYGIFASAYVSLFPPALVELFGMELMPQITGIMYMIMGVASMIGTPVAGALVRGHGEIKESGDYMGMGIMVGTLMAAAAIFVAWMRLEATADRAQGGRKWVWKL
ncbi:monocarboxylate transporter [Colletotrichum phormii]|uniref:Monocarboxylate transporter n=1 Tax=Colletotrichum phormii TaxID=359342 RepID=A0AAJ0EFL9_9PEZI|nr:monocarboxylate transporter [Colletotrichum phormii]KAK1635110.1 monocarboxylate transporter [Colletotrichum phormii]